MAVLVATRWIIAKLRNRRFFSLFELNAAIREMVTALNDRVTRSRTRLCANRRLPAFINALVMGGPTSMEVETHLPSNAWASPV